MAGLTSDSNTVPYEMSETEQNDENENTRQNIASEVSEPEQSETENPKRKKGKH